jgi:hypothetical protein
MEEVSESKENCLLQIGNKLAQANFDNYIHYLGPVFMSFLFSNNGSEGGYSHIRIIQRTVISGTPPMFKHGYQLSFMAISTKIFSHTTS